MTPNPSTGLVMLPKVVTGELARKFGEISLYNQYADFELGSDSNSNSTPPWAIACEPAIKPSRADSPLHEHFPYGLCNTSKAHAEALTARRAGKEIVSDYNSNSNPVSGYYSDSSYEFDFGSDPDEPESEISTAEQPLSGPTTGLVRCHPAMALLIRDLKPDPRKVRTGAQINRVRDDEGARIRAYPRAHQLKGAPHVVFKSHRGQLVEGSHRGRASAPSVPSERD
jgi:hypothetical protein